MPVAGERVVAGVAGALVADLGEQDRGGHGALWVAERGQEDLAVGMRANSGGDLALQYLRAMITRSAATRRPDGRLHGHHRLLLDRPERLPDAD
jgi:hypothetical protein